MRNTLRKILISLLITLTTLCQTQALFASSTVAEVKLVAQDSASNDHLGTSVVVNGNNYFVGTPFKFSSAGAVYAYQQNGLTFTPQGRLTANDAQPQDGFGGALAASPNTLAVGAKGRANNQGAVYLFTLSGDGTWQPQATITAPDGLKGDRFGDALAMDGETLAVGARFRGKYTGAVYVFVRNGTRWSYQTRLMAQDAEQGDSFGASVSLRGDTLLVGAHGKRAGIGCAYVFQRESGVWSQQAKLSTRDTIANDRFGYSVGLGSDFAAVGVPNKNNHAGVVAIFQKHGQQWQWKTQLTSDDPQPNDLFGWSLSANGFGVVVSAKRQDTSTGKAYAFSRQGNGWSLEQTLLDGNGFSQDLFGYALAADGNHVIVGAPNTTGGLGASYVFVLRSAPDLIASDGLSGDMFGTSVALSQNTMLVGSPLANNIGAGYLYVRDKAGWKQQSILSAPNALEGDLVGYATAVDGDTAVLGAPATSGGAGVVYLFQRSGSDWLLQATLSDPNGKPGDGFGSAVAIRGDNLLVGSPNANQSGSALLFNRQGTNWTLLTTLLPQNQPTNALFGYALSITETAFAIGSPSEDYGAGATYLYTNEGGTWKPTTRLTSDSTDLFGSAISLSGNTLAVGAPGTANLTGATYLYTLTKTGWQPQSILTATAGTQGDYFGASLGLSGDVLVVGAPSANLTGTCYLYVRSSGVWQLQGQRSAGDTYNGFGAAVAVSGSTFVATAPGYQSNRGGAEVYGNPPPLAQPDSYNLYGNNIFYALSEQSLLRNDTAPNGESLTAVVVALPMYGNLILNGDGTFVYTPNKKFSGTDQFAYYVTSGGGRSANGSASEVAWVTLSISPRKATTLKVPTISGTAGKSVSLKATLTSDSTPLGGKTLVFRLEGVVIGKAVTNASGIATLAYLLPKSTPLGKKQLIVQFDSDGTYSTCTTLSTLTVK